jgi:hypothetical protein
VSVCPDCLVSRIALADVSGHGQAVAVFAEKLRELMHRYLHSLEHIALMRDLNHAVREELGDGHYATMVAVGWRGRRGPVVMTNAGHPPHRAGPPGRGDEVGLRDLRSRRQTGADLAATMSVHQRGLAILCRNACPFQDIYPANECVFFSGKEFTNTGLPEHFTR